MSLIEYAECELDYAGLGDADSDYGGMLKTAALDLIRVFAEQGHSGASAAMVTGIVERLMRFEPLTPLTGADDEWNILDYDDHLYAQNRRCSRVFKRADGTAFDVEGRIFREPDGSCYTSRNSHVDITFPYTPTQEYVDVDEDGNPVDGTSQTAA